MRFAHLAAGLLLVGACGPAEKTDPKPPAEQVLFNGKDTAGWKLRTNTPERENKWAVAKGVSLTKDTPGRLDTEKGEGVLVNGGDGKGNDLLTEAEYGDCELHVEFLIPKGTNSGVFFMGRYEVQILDNFGKEDADTEARFTGSIYRTAAPKKNVSKAPGEWQSFDVVFHAPRFDAEGKKTADARFVKVLHNGELIHENVDVKAPNSGRSLDKNEVAKGPIMLQGTEAPVAFRNVKVKPLAGK
jgi:hypothetical protein